jgi:PadR family transcriptional regulator, regulatory protein PadR
VKRDEFARNLAAGTFDLIVLDVLRDGPSYGYGIRKRISKQSKHTLNWQDGTIYPVLRHLEEQGLITSQWQGPKDGRQRRQWNTFTRAVSALLNK